jgi:hypothetical protein
MKKKLVLVVMMCLIMPFFVIGCDNSSADDANDDSIAPEVVSTFPANGAVNVDKTITELTVTFNEEMANGYSFVPVAGYSFPGTLNEADYTITWNSDKKTITFVFAGAPLDANTEYRISLNSAQYNNFRDNAGNRLVPVEWIFTTGP